ncbi:MAG: Rrf2 family transcriptional regulator [Betaproteobacteria bacterium]|nr:Rrf2 family transcriptional regulator [Betaproteobacteria bacterium]
MDNTTVFSKTGKGLLKVKNRSNRISKERYRVLSLIDGKANLDELADRARTNPTALRQILTQLSEGGTSRPWSVRQPVTQDWGLVP